MRRKQPCSGSAAVAFFLMVFLLFFTLLTIYLFIVKKWPIVSTSLWFPEPITEFGREIDAQFFRTLIIVGIVFALSQIALGLLVFRFRDRGGRANYSHGNNTMEILWTLATAILFVGLGIYGRSAWADVHFRGAAPGAVQIEVLGQQFAWNFRYPGPDGKFGRIAAEFVKDSSGNFFGIDPGDPAGKDDIVSPVLAVPVNQEVQLLLRGKDVTHSFFVRELRLKQDTVPGMLIPIHFTPTKVGQYEIACAELCGLGHHRMRSFLQVLSAADYRKWLADQAANQ